MLTLPWGSRTKGARGGVSDGWASYSGAIAFTPSRALALATSPLQGEVKVKPSRERIVIASPSEAIQSKSAALDCFVARSSQ